MGSYLDELFGLRGRVAIVTGSTGGLGEAMAEALYCAGAKVIINGRYQERTEKAAAAALERLQGKAVLGADAELFPIAGDMKDMAQAAALVEKVEQKYGRIDILVNNAGVNLDEDSFENQLDQWDLLMSTNLTGVFNVTKAALPLLKQAPSGRIINMTSVLSHIGSAKNVLYSATKGGLLMWTKSLALDLAQTNVRVNCISPGPFQTAMNAKFEDEKAHTALMAVVPQQRMGVPSELCGAVIFLASEAGGYMTGSDIRIDGGMAT
ncbi:Nodulation protein G [Porphyridium purpureum]|uniref:3-oxoacyl-[acyl-carrier-protein] reductase n=1 Tax=Porphyridium purpureum TaxID=35688 RepID=A0A5J4Z2Z6_PORPP|nr:Nodulation protein G [Porphyridium purpureum]|eukprot:POR0792..scf295_1